MISKNTGIRQAHAQGRGFLSNQHDKSPLINSLSSLPHKSPIIHKRGDSGELSSEDDEGIIRAANATSRFEPNPLGFGNNSEHQNLNEFLNNHPISD
jgi:hypothetical protein